MSDEILAKAQVWGLMADWCITRMREAGAAGEQADYEELLKLNGQIAAYGAAMNFINENVQAIPLPPEPAACRIE